MTMGHHYGDDDDDDDDDTDDRRRRPPPLQHRWTTDHGQTDERTDGAECVSAKPCRCRYAYAYVYVQSVHVRVRVRLGVREVGSDTRRTEECRTEWRGVERRGEERRRGVKRRIEYGAGRDVRASSFQSRTGGGEAEEYQRFVRLCVFSVYPFVRFVRLWRAEQSDERGGGGGGRGGRGFERCFLRRIAFSAPSLPSLHPSSHLLTTIPLRIRSLRSHASSAPLFARPSPARSLPLPLSQLVHYAPSCSLPPVTHHARHN